MRKNGIILEIYDGRCLVMDGEAIIHEISCPAGAVVGKEISFREKTAQRKTVFSSLAAVAAMFVVFFGVANFMPVTSVYVDINPSIQLEMNRFDKVLSVEGLNEDGEELIAQLSVRGDTLEEALLLLAGEAAEKGYFNKEDATFSFTVISGNQSRAAKLTDLGDSILEEFFETESLEVTLVALVGTENLKDQAEELGISPGKLNLLNMLVEENPALDREDYLDASVQEIVKTFQEEHMANQTEKQETQPTINKANENSTTNNKDKDPATPSSKTNNKDKDPANPNSTTNNKDKDPANPNSTTNNKDKDPANPNSTTNSKDKDPANPNSKTTKPAIEDPPDSAAPDEGATGGNAEEVSAAESPPEQLVGETQPPPPDEEPQPNKANPNSQINHANENSQKETPGKGQAETPPESE